MPDRDDVVVGDHADPGSITAAPDVDLPVSWNAAAGDLFARTFRTGPAALSITRLSDGMILEINDALLEVLGYTREEVVGRTTVEIGIWVEQRSEIIARVKADGAVRDLGLAWKTPRGVVRTRTSIQLIHYNGEACLLSFFIDETEKVRALEALQASEERYRSIVREARDAMLTLGPNGKYVEVNDAACRLLGYSPEEFLSLGPVDIAHPDDRPTQQGHLKDLSSGEIVRTERKLRTKDGRTVWGELVANPLPGGGAHAIIRDVTDRHDAEQRYRAAVSQATDAITIVGPDGVYVDCNEAACRMFGYTREEFLRLRPSDLAAPDERQRQREEIRSVHAGAALRTERRLVARDGHVIWVDLTGNPLPGGSSQAIIRDITARKNAEERADRLLRLYAATADIDRAIGRITDSDELFSEACRIAHEVGGFVLVWVGLVMSGPAGPEVKLVSSAGRRLEELRSTRVSLDPGRSGPSRPGLTALAEDRPILTRYDDSGTPSPVRESLLEEQLKSSLLIPLHANGKAVGVLGIYDTQTDAFGPAESALLERIADDVSFRLDAIERDRAHRAIQSERDRLAQAVDQASDGMMIIGPRGFIDYANSRFAEMVGRSRESLIGTPAGEILRIGVGRPDLALEVRTAGMAQRPWTGEFDVVRPDGSAGRISLATTPVRDEVGRTVNVVAVMRDVTREHQLEQQLRQVQKMDAVGKLAGGIAHDFNNLLTAIGGYASLVKAQLGDSPITADVVAIQDAANRAAELTRQLPHFSRQMPISRAQFDLNAVTKNVAPMLRRLIEDNIVLEVRPGATRPMVAGDALQLEQAMMNLVLNARDAMPDGGVILIETSDVVIDEAFLAQHPDALPGPHVLLTVSDTGSGIAPEILDRVFDPFFTTKEQGKGTGLGLSMVFGTVKACDGTITVESVPGYGATFRIYLPCAPVSRATAPDQRPPGEPVLRRLDPALQGAGKTALIVEDEETVRSFGARVLRQAGFDVLEAADGHQALEMARSRPGPIDLVVTDVLMPGLTGPQTVELLREIRPDVPALFVSGYAERGVGDLAMKRSTYMQKPFEPAALLETIRQLLTGSAG